ncbi:hypothetical protein GWO43_16185 [candidate division KSB1 bacterium]|nr:hypothetical protein [candidate division KSB1 bacterium]NIV68773.1 hypothetical protein [Phycisphaerae bacterium]NIS25490.1 hypothetical protein [candidate division KSB1 bacterium]NIT72383.1 hypothetical protein [candidate division KSB1 bacterium]NIU26167.1 hypothetical protein [candidate division KSB1 bacterium]
MPKELSDLEPGYYKTRLYSRGPFVPVEVGYDEEFTRIHDGRIVSVGEYWCRWWPELNNPFYWCAVDPFEETGWGHRSDYFEPIDKDEFEWMLLLKSV